MTSNLNNLNTHRREDLVSPPAWVAALLAASIPAEKQGPLSTDDHDVVMTTAGGLCLVSTCVRGAAALTEPDFSAAIAQAYRAVFAALKGRQAHHPVRFWNHIPGLHDRMAPGLDRYMAFNAGRFVAMQEWFGGVSAVRRSVATASGIGHAGQDYVLHCLAANEPGTPVENPRQVPAYLYSRRFGPMPPCFARATIATLGGERWLLMAGTASIRGEESVHIGDLEAQLRETLVNMRAVIEAAGCAGAEGRDALECMHDCRVYHPRAEDGPALEAQLSRVLPAGIEVETVRADLCRAELLVEIEGVARLA